MKVSSRWYLVSLALSALSIATCFKGNQEEGREFLRRMTWREATEKKKDDGPATDGE